MRNWNTLSNASKAKAIAKIGIIGAAGIAAIIISKKAITKMTAEAISDVINPLMNDAPETTLEDFESEIQ